MIVKYEEKDVAEQIIGLLKSPHELEKYRKNAVRFAKRYDWNKIFYRVLNNL